MVFLRLILIAVALGLAAGAELDFVLGVNASCVAGTARKRYQNTTIHCYSLRDKDPWKCESEDHRVLVTDWRFQNDTMEYTALDQSFLTEFFNFIFHPFFIFIGSLIVVLSCACWHGAPAADPGKKVK